jgi:hypothetical protein
MLPIKSFVTNVLVEYRADNMRFISADDYIDWSKILEEGGYYGVTLSIDKFTVPQLSDMNSWCREKIGKEHYYWTGYVFWFDYEMDATMFALRWA